MTARQALAPALILIAASSACTSLPTPAQHWYAFPKNAYTDDGPRPHTTMGSVRARTDFPSLDPDNDDFDRLCRNYFNKSVVDLVKEAKERGADAVIQVHSVVFLSNGKKETYGTAECADDGEEGQSLAEGLAVKWVSVDGLKDSESTPPVSTKSGSAPKPPTGKAALAQLQREEATYAETSDQSKRFSLLMTMAQSAFDAGQAAKAQEYAQELVESSVSHKGEWAYGNAVHRGNLILGRLALRDGDIVKAKTYLLLAGKTPGSPQLDSFGPNMSLAKELLEKGERQIVLDYLDLCAKFWRDDFAQKQLAQWRSEIHAGKIPDFWAHLHD